MSPFQETTGQDDCLVVNVHTTNLMKKDTLLPGNFVYLDQWFLTGVPRNTWVPWKAVWVPPISCLDAHLQLNFS
jgi:hypothetical protein